MTGKHGRPANGSSSLLPCQLPVGHRWHLASPYRHPTITVLSGIQSFLKLNHMACLTSSENGNIYFIIHWVFAVTHGLSLVAASGGYSSLRCAGFSLWWFLLLRSTGSGAQASVVVARGLSSCGSWALALECRFSSCGARA